MSGRLTYQIELARVQLLDDAVGDGVDFHELAGFTLVIAKPGQRVIYSGCEWSGIDESAGLGAAVIESVSVVATGRMVLP